MTDHKHFPEGVDDLDAFFAAARREVPAPSEALMARVLVDALAAQPAPRAAVRTPRPGLWTQLREAMGGWPAMGGLATAGVVGLWIGISPPAAVTDMASDVLGLQTDEYLVDLMPDFEFDIAMDLSEG